MSKKKPIGIIIISRFWRGNSDKNFDTKLVNFTYNSNTNTCSCYKLKNHPVIGTKEAMVEYYKQINAGYAQAIVISMIKEIKENCSKIYLGLHDQHILDGLLPGQNNIETIEKLNPFLKEIKNLNVEFEGYLFQHSPGISIFDVLKKYLDSYDLSSFNQKNFYNDIIYAFQKKKLAKLFSLLKHRIAHLWLPLDIDLQGISEVMGRKTSDGKDIQVVYQKEVLEGKPEFYYRQKLVNFRYAITKDENNAEIDGISVDDEFKKLIRQSSLMDIIPEDKSPQEWGILLKLAGLKDNKPKHIIEFMAMLDGKISKANNVNLYDVSDVLDFFKSKDWKIKDANPDNIKSFHDWFFALDDCLERLRKIISQQVQKIIQ